MNRFKYTESVYESLFCIKYNIDRDKKICPVCGKGILKFTGERRNNYFSVGCCKKCKYEIRNKNAIMTSMKKYGTTHPSKNKERNEKILEKRKNTCIEKYGVEYSSQCEDVQAKRKETCLERYGVGCTFQSEKIKEKIRQTCLERYGVENSFQAEITKQHHKETLLEKYGVENSFRIPSVIESFNERKNEIQQKRDNTKRKNKTFGTSIPENKTYKLLLNKFDKDDIIRQYKDERYPFNCDFYIKSIDLFIECNYFWTHQKHFFNEKNEDDIKILNKMIELCNDKPFYKSAIKVWTESDILKRNTAINNKLNYIVFWNLDECKKWINDLNF